MPKEIDIEAMIKIIDNDLGCVRQLATPQRFEEILSSPERYTNLQLDLLTCLFASVEFEAPVFFTEACAQVISLLIAAKNGPPPTKKKKR